MVDADIARRRRLEDEYWRDSPTESPGADSIHNIVNKSREAGIFLDLLESRRRYFERAGTILELGAGQGWASCIVKRLFPTARVIVSDLSEHAVASVPQWERIYGAAVDQVLHGASESIDLPDSSVDVVFCFAAAHHFGAHRETLEKVRALLTDGGLAFYLYEPSCSPYLYGAAKRRVNRKRPEVPEDVLVYPEIVELATEVGLRCELEFYPRVADRGPVETVYYSLIRRSRALQTLLPCTVNYTFQKPKPAVGYDRSA